MKTKLKLLILICAVLCVGCGTSNTTFATGYGKCRFCGELGYTTAYSQYDGEASIQRRIDEGDPEIVALVICGNCRKKAGVK